MLIFLKKDLHKVLLIRRSLGPSLPLKSTFSSLPDTKDGQSEAKKGDEDWFNQVTECDIDERIVPKPISVMPDHLPQVRRRQVQKPWWKFRYFVDIHNNHPIEDKEYTEQPQYPPIFDSSYSGINKQIRLEWYNAIRRLPSSEQKIYEITKHYGHLSYLLEPVTSQYNSLPIQQSLTRTHLIHNLPKIYGTQDLQLDSNLKQALLTSISNRLYLTKSRKPSVDYKKTSLSQFGFTTDEDQVQSTKDEDILIDLVQLIRNFNSDKQELSNIQVDYNPFVATSWWMNDFPIPFKKKQWFKDQKTFDQNFTYKSTHAVHIRSGSPLPAIVPFDDPLCASEFSKFKLNLLQLGYPLKRHNIMSLPGFWPAKSGGFDFPYLIGHSRELLRSRKSKSMQDFNDTQDVLDGMAIMSSFAWLTSIANNLGFTIYDSLTYPLVNQVVITDGQFWSFYVFQLNNHAFHSDIIQDKSPSNLCWSSGEMKLFETFENGSFLGLNEDVLKTLVKFATVQTQNDSSQNLRPYLGVDERSQQDKDELNYSLRRKFVNATSTFIARRKKTNLWETVYKNHKEATLDNKRTRPKLDFKYPPFFK